MEFIVVLMMALFATWAVRRNRAKRLGPGPVPPARPIDPRTPVRPAAESLIERKARLERELAETEARRNELRSELLSVKNRLDEPDDGPPHR
ncbi:MAG TPA: hypothetical protein VJ694_00040 [Patescibacteria group bacterium]|nr:hypothetical protein [Patescibacteria group bacterium]